MRMDEEPLSDPPMTLVTQEMWDRMVAEKRNAQGYMDAFYEIANLLGLPAMPISPREAFETVMLPKLHRLIDTEGQR